MKISPAQINSCQPILAKFDFFKLELENRKNKFKFDGTLLHSARMFHRKKTKDFIKHEIYYFNRITMKVFIIAYIM